MSTLRGLMGSRRGKKAIRDELASEERCVEQWRREVYWESCFSAPAESLPSLALRTFSFECDGAPGVVG